MEWNKLDRGVYLVNVLGIVYDPKTKKILIGRRENDPHIKKLTWCFPGGRPKYEESLENGLEREILIKTGLEVKVKKLIFARTHPEKLEFLSLYYHCEVSGGMEKAGELLKELKWVKPEEIGKHFTTSVHPEITRYLKTLIA
ncbi:MAG TPA: NUDIX domain-containing protein [Candidatus Nanoarchaeia archaeon]|nr:NUDIX domain-containing protein [Candidatus Nanoarchaeia archaeon]